MQKRLAQDQHNPQPTDAGSDQSGQPTATQITLPKDGQFGAVVVGESLDEQYPELATVWGGRLAYTVFLHVGLARSWILQYSLPRTEEAAAAGTLARLEAPWPYNIVRPNLALGPVDGNTIMVHGFVNQAGRFEISTSSSRRNFPRPSLCSNLCRTGNSGQPARTGRPHEWKCCLIIPQEM